MSQLLFEYEPARVGPMTVALLLILALATPIAVADRLLAGRPVEAALALLPAALLIVFALLSAPSPLRIFDDAVEVSRSRLPRVLGVALRIPMAEIENVYPSFYEDAGMRFSPFASAEGTAKHAGIRLETRSGQKFMVAFTPTVLNLGRHGTPAYDEALDAMRKARGAAGMPLVAKPPEYTQHQVDEMLVQAARPLMPFPVTVGGIFAPALLIPLLFVLAGRILGAVPEGVALGLAGVGLAPLLAVFILVNVRSSRRAHLLHEVQKFREHVKERAKKA